MSTEVENGLRDLFLAALDCDSLDAQHRFLDHACEGQPGLRRRVEQLLLAHRGCGDFLGGQQANDGPSGQFVRPGATIGRFRLLAPLGEGGFGVVYLAEQFQPVVRLVALKVIKPGMDTRQVIARFQSERQALALMDHPNIAQIYDGGETPCGHPYVVMELVDGGLPITEYCDKHRLPISDRLRLFLDVCSAVQHAHQKGLIHCDLKPSNVLVTIRDGRQVPKVIDFGIAKVLKRPTGEGTESIAIAMLQGSPNYMSPEQWPLSGLDVDTRSDVYSLGALLYQLLSGFTPFQRNEWSTTKWDDLFRQVRDEDPQPPSQQLAQRSADAAARAAVRRSDPNRLVRVLRGELDWIVLKALAADRRRRYDSVGGFADDLERFLCNEHVQAVPPTRAYRLQKMIRRNRTALGTFTVVLVCLALATAFSLFAAVRARRAEDLANQRLILWQAEAARAERATDAAVAEQKNTERQWQRAESNLQQARAMVDRVLQRISPANSRAAHSIETLRQDILQDAIVFFHDFIRVNASDPRLRTDLATTLLQVADAHIGLSEWGQAEQSCRAAIEIICELQAQNPAEPALTRQLAIAQLRLGSILRTSGIRFSEAEQLYRQALATFDSLGAFDPSAGTDWQILVDGLADFGHFLGFTLGRRAEAKPFLARAVAGRRRAAELAPDFECRIGLARVCNSLGILYRQSTEPGRAAALHHESIALLDQVVAEGYPGDLRSEQARSWTHLGMAKIATGDLEGAETDLKCAVELRGTLAVARPVNRNLHVELALNKLQLAGVLQMREQWEQAEQELRTSASLLDDLVRSAPHDISIEHFALDARRRLGDLLVARDDRRAATMLYAALEGQPISNAASAQVMAWHWANCPLLDRRNPGKAIELALRAVRGSPDQGTHWTTLGCAQLRAGDFRAAQGALQKALELLADVGDSTPGFLLAITHAHIGDQLQAQRYFELADTQLKHRPTWIPEDDLLAAEARRQLFTARSLLKK